MQVMKTYHMYNADSISAQSKLKEAEKQEEKQIGKSVKQEDRQAPRSPDSTSNVRIEEKHVRRSSVKKIEKMKEKVCGLWGGTLWKSGLQGDFQCALRRAERGSSGFLQRLVTLQSALKEILVIGRTWASIADQRETVVAFPKPGRGTVDVGFGFRSPAFSGRYADTPSGWQCGAGGRNSQTEPKWDTRLK